MGRAGRGHRVLPRPLGVPAGRPGVCRARSPGRSVPGAGRRGDPGGHRVAAGPGRYRVRHDRRDGDRRGGDGGQPGRTGRAALHRYLGGGCDPGRAARRVRPAAVRAVDRGPQAGGRGDPRAAGRRRGRVGRCLGPGQRGDGRRAAVDRGRRHDRGSPGAGGDRPGHVRAAGHRRPGAGGGHPGGYASTDPRAARGMSVGGRRDRAAQAIGVPAAGPHVGQPAVHRVRGDRRPAGLGEPAGQGGGAGGVLDVGGRQRASDPGTARPTCGTSGPGGGRRVAGPPVAFAAARRIGTGTVGAALGPAGR